VLRIILSVIAAIVLLYLAIKVVAAAFSFIFYILALLLIGYVVYYFIAGAKRGD
jgi:uncharacterized membrane protein